MSMAISLDEMFDMYLKYIWKANLFRRLKCKKYLPSDLPTVLRYALFCY